MTGHSYEWLEHTRGNEDEQDSQWVQFSLLATASPMSLQVLRARAIAIKKYFLHT